MKKNRLLFFSGLAALLFGGLGLSVEANPSGFFTNCATNTSTSTVSLMTAGTATTTLTCNLGGADQRAVESAVLTIFFNASSTSSVLKGNLEYSNNGIDWFENNLGDLTDVATTRLFSNQSIPLFEYSRFPLRTEEVEEALKKIVNTPDSTPLRFASPSLHVR